MNSPTKFPLDKMLKSIEILLKTANQMHFMLFFYCDRKGAHQQESKLLFISKDARQGYFHNNS